MIAPPQPIGAILSAQSKAILINWTTTPYPVDYGDDGHFCLLAIITKATASKDATERIVWISGRKGFQSAFPF